MSGRDDDPSDFADAMRDVKPIAERDRARPPTPPTPGRTPAGAAPPVRFEGLVTGERLEGLAPGIDRKLLRRLKAGGYPVESRVDLHGLLGAEAREAVRTTLLDACDSGFRCVLVVHGRGLHSPGAPVLKRALPGWLAEPPLGQRVLAFASSTPEHGGTGATFVLLRRDAGASP